jgi:hypothetical protein
VTRPGIMPGICGEHGVDPDSVKFCQRGLPTLRALFAVPRTRRPPRRRASRAGRGSRQAGEEEVSLRSGRSEERR